MNYAPRTIAFSCELLHPPTAPDPGPIQRLHNRMFQSSGPLYRSFTVTQDGAILSNPAARNGAVSLVAFLPDRFQFREDLTGITAEGFAERVKHVTELAASMTRTQLFLAQQVTVRTLVNPRHFNDSRNFFKAGMFGFHEELEEFEREAQLFGLRMVFPATAEQPNTFALRLESFTSDPRSLFVENQGSFGPVVAGQNLDAVASNILATYNFATERALSFVSRFDARQRA